MLYYKILFIIFALGAGLWFFTSKYEGFLSSLSSSKVRRNAGYLLRKDGLLLLVRSATSGKWGIPAGKPKGRETADQTAVRETFEETGLEVEAVKLLVNVKNEFYIYECRLKDLTSLKDQCALRVPPGAKSEIAEVSFISPETLTPSNVRYPQFLPRLFSLLATLK